jgi:hypothetical protein
MLLTRNGADSARWVRIVRTVNADRLEPKEKFQANYRARWEALEIIHGQELAAMTEDRARQIIQSLGAVAGWRERSDWSGLVEQQAIFQRGRRS